MSRPLPSWYAAVMAALVAIAVAGWVAVAVQVAGR